MLTKKKITKLLNADFRKRILTSVSSNVLQQYKVLQYARYLADSQIISRSKEHMNDKNAYYGFSPVNFICAKMYDGSIAKKFFEFNIINHFLVKKDGDSAIETIACILIDWLKEDKHIMSFDPIAIDAELKQIEKDYIEKQEKADNDVNDSEQQ